MAAVGRHSSGDDEDEGGEDVVWVPIPASQITGEIPRIQLTGEIPIVQLTGEIPIVEGTTVVLPEVARPDQDVPAEHDASPARDVSPTRADLLLIRSSPAVRARVLAAVVAPFLLYTLVMVLAHRMDIAYLIWLWIPTVLACGLVGHFLDVAHAHARDAEPSRRS